MREDIGTKGELITKLAKEVKDFVSAYGGASDLLFCYRKQDNKYEVEIYVSGPCGPIGTHLIKRLRVDA